MATTRRRKKCSKCGKLAHTYSGVCESCVMKYGSTRYMKPKRKK